jgi:hypothetical protein
MAAMRLANHTLNSTAHHSNTVEDTKGPIWLRRRSVTATDWHAWDPTSIHLPETKCRGQSSGQNVGEQGSAATASSAVVFDQAWRLGD